MRIKRTFLLAFLLVLYIGPSLFTMSYGSSATLAEQNTSKEFALSTEYTTSNQSITSFSETLDDDVIFYPDNESYGSGYAESFADVGDWSGYTTEGDDSISSDGDIATIVFADADNADYWQTASSLGVITGHYIEIYSKYNTSAYGSKVSWVLLKGGLMGAGGSSAQTYSISASGVSWQSNKVLITTTDIITGIAFYCGDADGPYEVEFDYLRISPADEMGWQDDCATDTSFTNLTDMTASSDGDKVTLTCTGGTYGTTFVYFDNTTTIAQIDTDYYPFVGLYQVGGTFPNSWKLYATWSDDSTTEISAYHSTTGMNRYNLRAVSEGLDLQYLTIQVLFYGTKTVIFDFIKLYSIANYTVTQSGTSIDDVLYVDSDVLYCSGTSFTSFVLDHDPALSFNTTTIPSSTWSMTTSSGTPEIDLYHEGAWLGYSSDTSGSFPTGTLTDIRIRFTDSANIEAINFLSPIPQWNEINEAELIFIVVFDEWALDMGLIFLGLLLIPASTVYMAKGGLKDASMTKVFFAIVAFVIGCALFVGGIM